jgi:catechol 2,3-dioxygenase-like lactoylglutathione lyase family enzyme
VEIRSARLARHTGRFDDVTSFYRDILGFEVVMQWDRGPGQRGMILSPPGEVAGFTVEILDQSPGGELRDHSSFGIQVDDVDAIQKQLADRGVAIEERARDMPWGHRTLYLRDPDGLRIWIYHELG